MKTQMKVIFFDVKRIPIVLAAFLLLLFLARLIFFYFSSRQVLIGVVPDDAFYYLQMATHRAKDGFWTFDGTSPATGFHFLYGYFLAFIFKFLPSISWVSIYLIIGTLSCLSISASVYFLVKAVIDLYGKEVAFAAMLPFVTFPIMMQSTDMMESWLVVLFSSLTIFFIAKEQSSSVGLFVTLFAIGLLGSLSRSDYGMLPGVLFCVLFLSQKLKITPVVVRSICILLGAIFGVFLVLIQNYFISGQLAQASAQIKLFWSSIVGHSIEAPWDLVRQMLFPFADSRDLQIKVFLLLVIYSCIKSIKFLGKGNSLLPTTLLIGCALTVLSYIFFYRYNSGALQIWYSANFVAPLAILTAATFHFLLGRRAQIPALLLLIIYLIPGSKSLFSIPWPQQVGMMNAGLYIRALDGEAKFAAWNAGIVSYFSEKPLVNIDGLTNDEVQPYIKNNKLMDYLKIKNINYIVDNKVMIDSQNLRIRGGYDDERVFRCLIPIKPVDGVSIHMIGSAIVLFKVDSNCL